LSTTTPRHRSSLSYWGFLCARISGPASQLSRLNVPFCCILTCCYDSIAASISHVSESTSVAMLL
jgi:hypothetical protein